VTWPPLVALKKRKHSGGVIFEGATLLSLLPVARSNLGPKSKRAGPTTNSKYPLSRGEGSGQTLNNSRWAQACAPPSSPEQKLMRLNER
jgi:hypothetical protein